jgi:lysine 2,3-aminomutase
MRASTTLRDAQTLRDAGALLDAALIEPTDRDAIARVAARYAIAIPPALQSLIEHADDPIARQFVPHPDELVTAPHETADPIADEAFSPVRGIVHRYPDRALLKPLLVCPVYCRFCFRREQVGPKASEASGGLLSATELEAAYAYLRAHTELREIILTGGDPLMLSPRRLTGILSTLDTIPHMDTLRIHTRLPVATPEAVTPGLLAALRTEKPLWLAIHANSAREFTPASRAALAQLARVAPLLGQSVLLAGVNDTPETMEALLRAMLAARIKPYYLHQLDAAPGTARFHVPVERGRAILASLRGRIGGLAIPTYVLDIPGGHGKVPIAPDHWRDGSVLDRDFTQHQVAVPHVAPERPTR